MTKEEIKQFFKNYDKPDEIEFAYLIDNLSGVLQQGANIQFTPNPDGTITISATFELINEAIQDLVGPMVKTDGKHLSATYNGVSKEVTISAPNLLDYKNIVNASSNPNWPASKVGDTYFVGTAGKMGGDNGREVQLGNVFFSVSEGPSGTDAEQGARWKVIQGNIANSVVEDIIKNFIQVQKHITGAFNATTNKYVISGANLFHFRGYIDARLNPNYPLGEVGDFYLVSHTGLLGGVAGRSVFEGNMVFAVADNIGGTHAAAGAAWWVIGSMTAEDLAGFTRIKKYTITADGTASTFTFPHLFISEDLIIRVKDGTRTIDATITNDDTDITITFFAPPEAGKEYTILATGITSAP